MSFLNNVWSRAPDGADGLGDNGRGSRAGGGPVGRGRASQCKPQNASQHRSTGRTDR